MGCSVGLALHAGSGAGPDVCAHAHWNDLGLVWNLPIQHALSRVCKVRSEMGPACAARGMWG